MDDYCNSECEDCGWQGSYMELVCSDDDDKSDKPVSEIEFNRCPDCDGLNIVSIDAEEA